MVPWLFAAPLLISILLNIYLLKRLSNLKKKRKSPKDSKLSENSNSLDNSLHFNEISTLMHQMVHEINTPLLGVSSAAKELEQLKSLSQIREMTKVIALGIENLKRITTNYTSFFKLEKGHSNILEESFSLSESIEEILRVFHFSAESNQVELIFHNRELRDFIVRGDKLKFQQIFSNLVNNAIKFSLNNDIVVSLERIVQDEIKDSGSFRFSVEDHGLGMSSERVASLFAEESSATDSIINPNGSGIGLKLVRQLVKLLDGNLKIKSEINLGTTAIVDLSFDVLSSERIIQENSKEIFADQSILIASPSLALCAYFVDIAKFFSSKVTVFDLNEIDQFRIYEDKHDISFIDLNIEKNKGVYLGDKLKKNNPSILNISLSNLNLNSIRKSDLGGIFDAHLTKPVNYKSISQLLSELNPISDKDLHLKTKRDIFYQRKTLSILVIEDDIITRKMIEFVFKKMNYPVHFLSRGDEALKLLQSKYFDVLFLDLKLEDMSGPKLCSELRKQNFDFSSSKIFGISALVDSELRKRCIEVGMVDLIAKPLSTEKIIGILEKLRGKDQEQQGNEKEIENAKKRSDIEIVREENPELYKKIISRFLDEVPKLITEIEHFLESSNFEEIRKRFHKLKGMAANLNQDKLIDLFEVWEREYQALNMQSLNDLRSKLDEILERFKFNEDNSN